MRQRICLALDHSGTIVYISDLSAAARRSGLTERNVVGVKFWDFTEPHQRALVRQRFSECVMDGGTVVYDGQSTIEGVEETWNVRLTRLDEPAAYLAVAVQVFPGELPHLSQADHRTLRMLADDFTIEEMAKSMRTSVGTVTNRLHRLREKFRVRTNHGLVAAAARLGVLVGVTASG